MGKTGVFFKGLLNGVATMLNASGSALVSMYDTGEFVVNRARTAVLPCEKARLERRIKEYGTRILALQYEIGKESARCSDPSEVVESLELRANIARVRDCEAEIETMKRRLLEIAESKEAAKAEKKAKKNKKKKTAPATVKQETGDESPIAEAQTVVSTAVEAPAVTEEEPVAEKKEDADICQASDCSCGTHASA